MSTRFKGNDDALFRRHYMPWNRRNTGVKVRCRVCDDRPVSVPNGRCRSCAAKANREQAIATRRANKKAKEQS